ncbi:MAG: hypothetical protein JGK26_06685 [Microcoleus sp. PH2017_27_LUM_O_A]|uniref:hypothetical protein n=1 Tax=unclassified Microcoleus TaxID=2642155 RepID=UPI001D1CA9E9|nr:MULTISPECIES: hypothetical protein [unclassified Microcoleus]MCC3459464.1 hypothetical protein [Microcoleus sp. PH2017_11_PCY_U_A]MCC3558817.1 hypothetical protein [Microcoleus sp. PH2017_27_LUM_O_A]
MISALRSNMSLHPGRSQKCSNSYQNYLVRVSSAAIEVFSIKNNLLYLSDYRTNRRGVPR